jgi:hypothetical protein
LLLIFGTDLKKACLRLCASFLFPTPAAAADVLWMEQAQRLQEISAALLETIPVPQPLGVGPEFALKADLSFLPSPNPTVGAKLEKLPSAPVQSIPSVAASWGTTLGGSESLSAELWAGILPAGVEKLLGIKAALSQTHFGARIQLASARLGQARMTLGAGMARTQSTMTGQISSSEGSDLFTAHSTLSFTDLAFQHQRSGLWAGLALGKRRAESRLSIEEDDTDLEITDTLSNARQPYWSQLTLGLKGNSSWSFAVSELIVPDRIEMPRLTLAWSFRLH